MPLAGYYHPRGCTQFKGKYMHIQDFNYNGTIIQRRADGFINLTQMCQANGKRLTHWLNLKSTQDYIEYIATEDGIAATDVIEVIQGGSIQGTWGHPELAIDLAKWISNQFRRWCNAHIFNLMATGKTSIEIDPIEEMQLKLEYQKLQNQGTKLDIQKNQSELALLQFRHTVVSMCPEPIQQKILGYREIEKVEYRDRLIKGEEIINDGETITKTELCHRYSILTRNGKPDYKALNQMLENAGLMDNPEMWETAMSVREDKQLKREAIALLDDYYQAMPRTRYFPEVLPIR